MQRNQKVGPNTSVYICRGANVQMLMLLVLSVHDTEVAPPNSTQIAFSDP